MAPFARVTGPTFHVRPDGEPCTAPLWRVERPGTETEPGSVELRRAEWVDAVAYARERAAIEDGDFIVRGDPAPTMGVVADPS